MLKAIRNLVGAKRNKSESMRIYAMHWVPRDEAKIIEDALSEGDHAFEAMGTTNDGEQIICVHNAQKCYIATIEIDQLDVGLGKALIIKGVNEVEPGKVRHFVEQLRDL